MSNLDKLKDGIDQVADKLKAAAEAATKKSADIAHKTGAAIEEQGEKLKQAGR